MPGYLYIASNAAYPSLLKVGQTSDSPEKRIRELSTTSVPFPFLLEACFRVLDQKQTEISAHMALEQYRPAQNREFFEIDISSALQIIIPIVLDHKQVASSSSEKEVKEIPIPKDELELLQRIVSGGTTYGVAQWRLSDPFNTNNNLEVEFALARLERKKFIKCDRRTSGNGPIWLPTTRGINFLHDNNLVEDWMHRPW